MPHRHPINVIGECVNIWIWLGFFWRNQSQFFFLRGFSVGKPILVQQNLDPTEEEVSVVHQLYQDTLVELFDTHKAANG